MKDDQQNYWQPQDEAEAPQPAAPKEAEPKADVQSAEKQEVPTSPEVQTSVAPPRPRKQAEMPDEVSWEASEIMEHSRGPLWFIGFIALTVIIIGALIYFQEWIFAVLVLVMAVAVVIIARRPAHVIKYMLDQSGLRVNEKLYYYTDFRAFGIVNDGAFFAIKLIPVKRFSPEIMVYFSERDGEKIVDMLGSFLPMEDMKLDLADKIIRKIRL